MNETLPIRPPRPLAEILDEQSLRWRRGDKLFLESFLEQLPERVTEREQILDLLCNEIHQRRTRGESPNLEDYRRRFPEYAAELEIWFAMGAAVDENLGAGIETTVPEQPAPPQESASRIRIPDFEIFEELGRGGMGVVYKARQVRLNRPVALKMILAGGMASPNELARFQIEAEAVAALKHPNILEVYEAGEQDGLPYLAMEFAEGGSLAARHSRGPVPLQETAATVEALARAIHFAHQRGVIHRDLKPANVLQSVDGTLKIADFGLAKRLDRVQNITIQQSGGFLGSPPYSSPEQIRGTPPVDVRTDVYSLGAILYELLTQRPPFPLGAMPVPLGEVLEQVQTRQPESPSSVRPGVPRDLEVICLKCLEKEATQRYASAEELAQDLARYRDGEPIKARPVGRFIRFWKWCRRNPLIAGSLSVIVLLVSAFVGGLLLSIRTLEREQAQTKRALTELEQTTNSARQTIMDIVMRLEDKHLPPSPEMEALRRYVSDKALQLEFRHLEQENEIPEARYTSGITYLFIGGIHRCRGERDRTQKAYHQAIAKYEQTQREFPTEPKASHGVGQGHHILALELNATGHHEEVTEECRLAGEAYRRALELDPEDLESLNYSSWFLSIAPDPQFRNPKRAVELAAKFVDKAPELAAGWNDLGTARYRVGDWTGAVEALQQAMRLRENGGIGQDMFVLSMAYWRLGKLAEAKKWFDKAVDWTDTYSASDPEGYLFRKEAIELMGRDFLKQPPKEG